MKSICLAAPDHQHSLDISQDSCEWCGETIELESGRYVATVAQ